MDLTWPSVPLPLSQRLQWGPLNQPLCTTATTAQEPLTTTTQAPPLTVTKFICNKNEPDTPICDKALDSKSGRCRGGGKIWWELECPTPDGGGSPTPAPVNLPTSSPVDSCFVTGERCDKNGDGTECCSGVCLGKQGGTCQ